MLLMFSNEGPMIAGPPKYCKTGANFFTFPLKQPRQMAVAGDTHFRITMEKREGPQVL